MTALRISLLVSALSKVTLMSNGHPTRDFHGHGLIVIVIAQRVEEGFERRKISRIKVELLQQWVQARLSRCVAPIERFADSTGRLANI